MLLLKLTIEIMIVAIEIVVLQRVVCITEVIKNKREIFRAIVKCFSVYRIYSPITQAIFGNFFPKRGVELIAESFE